MKRTGVQPLAELARPLQSRELDAPNPEPANMHAEAIRDELRYGESDSLRRRRKIGLLAALGLADFALLSLYQMGVVRRLVDPPGRIFDSNRVNASKKAYSIAGVPDATLMATLYGITLVLASAKGDRRTGRGPALDAALTGVAAAGAAGALDYLRDMVFEQKRVCPYCLLGAGLNLGIFALSAANLQQVLDDARAGDDRDR